MAAPFALLCLLAAFGAASCGEESDAGESETPSVAPAQRDLSVKPVIGKPSGTAPRKLAKEDIVKGKGRAAKPGDTVVVNYVGVSFSTGKEFDASWDTGRTFPVPLGAGQVIEGWERGLVGMRKGGRRKLTIPPELAYGREGFPPAIAPNETLVFVIDAVAIK